MVSRYSATEGSLGRQSERSCYAFSAQEIRKFPVIRNGKRRVVTNDGIQRADTKIHQPSSAAVVSGDAEK
jgi:hypothetical protein